MGTLAHQKLKKKNVGSGSEKRSQGKPIQRKKDENQADVDLKRKQYELPPDYHHLNEPDWNDSKVQAWDKEQEQAILRRYGRLSCKSYDMI